jgi:hypothetical protein
MTIDENAQNSTANASFSNLECITPNTKKRTVEHFDSSVDLHSSSELRWLDSSSFSATLSRRNSIATDEPPRLPTRGTDTYEPLTPGKTFTRVPLPSSSEVPVRFVSVLPQHQRNVSQLSVPSLSTIDIDTAVSEKLESVTVLHTRFCSNSSLPFLGNLILDTDELTYSDVDEKSFVSGSLLCQLELENGLG